jgi:hypothetical protein
MSEYTIHYLLGIEGKKLLIVFYTARNSYQFQIVTATGEVIGDESIYCTVNAALSSGRKWVEVEKQS